MEEHYLQFPKHFISLEDLFVNKHELYCYLLQTRCKLVFPHWNAAA